MQGLLILCKYKIFINFSKIYARLMGNGKILIKIFENDFLLIRYFNFQYKLNKNVFLQKQLLYEGIMTCSHLLIV